MLRFRIILILMPVQSKLKAPLWRCFFYVIKIEAVLRGADWKNRR